MPKGVYETEYGNAAFVSGEYAYDLDMGEEIPLSMVTGDRIRDAEPGDDPRS